MSAILVITPSSILHHPSSSIIHHQSSIILHPLSSILIHHPPSSTTTTSTYLESHVENKARAGEASFILHPPWTFVLLQYGRWDEDGGWWMVDGGWWMV